MRATLFGQVNCLMGRCHGGAYCSGDCIDCVVLGGPVQRKSAAGLKRPLAHQLTTFCFDIYKQGVRIHHGLNKLGEQWFGQKRSNHNLRRLYARAVAKDVPGSIWPPTLSLLLVPNRVKTFSDNRFGKIRYALIVLRITDSLRLLLSLNLVIGYPKRNKDGHNRAYRLDPARPKFPAEIGHITKEKKASAEQNADSNRGNESIARTLVSIVHKEIVAC